MAAAVATPYQQPPQGSYPAMLYDHLRRMDSTSSSVSKSSIKSTNRPLPAIPLNSPPTTPVSPVLSPVESPQSTHRPPMRNRSITGSVMRTRRESYFAPRATHSRCNFLTTFTNAKCLAALLARLDWLDFLAVSTTCKEMRRILRVPQLRDVVLSSFVPGYSYVLKHRDLEQFKDVPLSIFHLNLFMMSQATPLHRYPMHALAVQSAMLPSMEQEETTKKMIALTEAHSRVVLFLQSLAHSSSSLPPAEHKDPTARARHSGIQSAPATSSFHPRELSFPAPLSYKSSSRPPSQPPSPQKSVDSLVQPKKQKKDSQHSRSASSFSSSSPKLARISGNNLSSASLSHRKSKSRLSIFGNSKTELPPPADPIMLKAYSSSWRRTLFHSSGGFASDDEDTPLERPHSRFASSTGFSSSDSGSSSALHSRESNVGNGSLLRFPKRQPSPHPQTWSSSPHDIRLATSRVRAPILRVFHPCTDLSEDSEALQQCEDQLIESGLWEHLSTGDVVVNLGYIPPSDDSSDDSMHSSSPKKEWLLFNGEVLIPYMPPEQLLPLPNPLSLPSPFYYSHLFPAYANPVFVLPRFPQVDDVPQLSMVHVSTKVPSLRSSEGFMWVKRYCWTARVSVHQGVALGTDNEALGLGWLGEWVLQGDGTKEGRKVLLDCLRGYDASQGRKGLRWELVREKSGGGRVWFRLLDTVYPSHRDHTTLPDFR